MRLAFLKYTKYSCEIQPFPVKKSLAESSCRTQWYCREFSILNGGKIYNLLLECDMETPLGEPPCHSVTFPLSGGTSGGASHASPIAVPAEAQPSGGFGGERRRCAVTELFALGRKRGIRSHRRRGRWRKAPEGFPQEDFLRCCCAPPPGAVGTKRRRTSGRERFPAHEFHWS